MKRIQIVSIMGIVMMVLASCATMRYEKFDDGLGPEDDPWTEEETILKESLWSDATIIEEFDDAEIEQILTEFPGRMKKEVKEGVLHVMKTGEKEGLFRIGKRGASYEKIVVCLRSGGEVYFSSHTKQAGDYVNDIEPAIFLNDNRTSVSNFHQDGTDWSSEVLYHSDYGKISDWTVVELRNTDEGLSFSVNGDHKATAYINGRTFPGIWFHLKEGNDSAEVDYILLK